MSTPKSTNPLETSAPIRPTVSHRKPKADMYTVLLVISLIAVLLGILFLYLHMGRYDFKFKGGSAMVMVHDQGPEARGQRSEVRGQELDMTVYRPLRGLNTSLAHCQASVANRRPLAPLTSDL